MTRIPVLQPFGRQDAVIPHVYRPRMAAAMEQLSAAVYQETTLTYREAEGARIRDSAQLKAAQANLERYTQLLKDNLVSSQQVDDQRALVGQAQGALEIDEAQVRTARLNLETYQDNLRQLDLSREQALRSLELLVGRYPAAALAGCLAPAGGTCDRR